MKYELLDLCWRVVGWAMEKLARLDDRQSIVILAGETSTKVTQERIRDYRDL